MTEARQRLTDGDSICGIDPGVTSPGLAVLRRERGRWVYVDSPVLHSLEELADHMQRAPWVKLVACESVTSSVHWAGKTQGFGSARILEAVGMARYLAVQVQCPFVEVHPMAWRKSVTGSGKATKAQCRRALGALVVGWPKGAGLNRCDAACVAIAGAMRSRDHGAQATVDAL